MKNTKMLNYNNQQKDNYMQILNQVKLQPRLDGIHILGNKNIIEEQQLKVPFSLHEQIHIKMR